MQYVIISKVSVAFSVQLPLLCVYIKFKLMIKLRHHLTYSIGLEYARQASIAWKCIFKKSFRRFAIYRCFTGSMSPKSTSSTFMMLSSTFSSSSVSIDTTLALYQQLSSGTKAATKAPISYYKQ